MSNEVTCVPWCYRPMNRGVLSLGVAHSHPRDCLHRDNDPDHRPEPARPPVLVQTRALTAPAAHYTLQPAGLSPRHREPAPRYQPPERRIAIIFSAATNPRSRPKRHPPVRPRRRSHEQSSSTSSTLHPPNAALIGPRSVIPRPGTHEAGACSYLGCSVEWRPIATPSPSEIGRRVIKQTRHPADKLAQPREAWRRHTSNEAGLAPRIRS